MSVKLQFFLPKIPRPSVLAPGLEFRAESPKATVILIHGLTGTPNEMKFLATYFHRQGYSVICPRLALHGEPMHVLKRGKWQEFYQTVKDTLAGIPAGEKVFVAGLSMGALFALLLAEEFPDRIAGAICLSPTLFFDGWNVPWSHRLLPLVYHSPLRHYLYHKEELPYGIKNERVRQMVHRAYKDASLSDISGANKYGYGYFPVNLFCELMDVIALVKKKLPQIYVPVQMIQAYEDDMTSIKNSQYIHDRIRSQKKEIVFLHDSYHVITADQERETVAQNMNRFLTEILNERMTPAGFKAYDQKVEVIN